MGDQSVAGLLQDDLLYHLLWKPVSPWKRLERGLKDVPSWLRLSVKQWHDSKTHIQQPEQWGTRPICFVIESQFNLFGKHLRSRVKRYGTPMSFTLTSGILAKCGNPTKLLIIFSFLTLLSSKFGPNRAWRRSSRSNYRRFVLSKRGDIAPQAQLQ
jgi:hypothetical protein